MVSLGETLFYTVIVCYGLSMILPLLFIRNYKYGVRTGLVFTALASIMQIVLAVYVFLTNTAIVINDLISIDVFASYFLALVGLAGLATSIYGLEYMDLYVEIGGGWLYSIVFAAFLLSMTLLPMMKDLLLFVFFWEVMTLTSIVLIGWEYREGFVVRATKQYMFTMLLLNSIPLIMGTCILWNIYGTTNLGLLASYDVVKNPLGLLVVLLFYIAFTSKAGLFPLHYWLPDAHPAAPSNVSSLLSGVMIKMGVMGIIVILYKYLGLPTILSYLLLVQALLSIFWGSIKAVMEDHAKRLLAYSSISQIGYITAPIALAFIASRTDPLLASIMLGAGLSYMFIHSLFKTLLFLTSGCFLYVSGKIMLDEIRGMAWTSKTLVLSIIIAGFSLAGIPPLAGFMAKIMVYGSILLGKNIVHGLVVAILMSMAPLTLLYSIKYVSSTTSLSSKIELGKSIGTSMKIGMIIPALALIVLSIVSLNKFFTNLSSILLGIRVETIIPSLSDFFYLVINPYIFYGSLIVFAALIIAVIISYSDYKNGKDIISKGVWTTGYIIPVNKHLIRPSYYYFEINKALSPLTGFFHEIYECLVWNIPSRIVRNGIARRIAEYFGRVNDWVWRKLCGFAEKYSRYEEYKLDEYAGSAIVSIIRLIGNIARMAVVSPIALFTIALFFLSIIMLLIILFLGGWP